MIWTVHIEVLYYPCDILSPKFTWNDIDPSGLSKASEVEGQPTKKNIKYIYVQTKLQTSIEVQQKKTLLEVLFITQN